MKIQPKDIVAIILILSFTFLKFNGFNGYLDGLMSFIVGYYFVKRVEKKDSGQ